MDDLLVVQDVNKFFRKKKSEFQAIKNVNLKVHSGECVGLIGESGSGKTTLANIIAGFLDADNGEIFFQGQQLSGKKGKEAGLLRKDMQMVFQNPQSSFAPRMTLGAGICEGLNYNTRICRAQKNKMVDDIMVRVNLPLSYKKKYCFEVSGGECQRAALARAVLIRPKLLLCDEITSALDVSVQKQMIDLLLELKEEMGMALLFISHDIALVNQFCDYVYVMQQGEIVEEGAAKNIFKNPVHEYTKKMLDSVLKV